MRVGPDVFTRGRVVHRRVVNGAGEMRAVGEDVVEVAVTDTQSGRDDAKDSGLEIEEPPVEFEQHCTDTGDGSFGQCLVEIAMRIPSAQWMVRGDLGAPVEHLLPIGDVAAGRGLDEQPGVTRLPVTSGYLPAVLFLGRPREELREHRVGLVEQRGRDVVTREDEARAQATGDAVDDRPPLCITPVFEREQVDVEDVRHCVYVSGWSAPFRMNETITG